MSEPTEVRRFSDQELQEFHEQFKQHIAMYSERIKTDDSRHKNLLDAQEKTNGQLDSLIKNTEEIVVLYTDVKGTIRIGIVIQKFFLWVAKWGFIGAIATGIWEFIIKRVH